MKTKLLFTSVTALLATALIHATPADDLAAAAKKISDAPNYGWTTTTTIANSQFPSTPVEGVTEKDGYTIITRTFNGNTTQTVRKGEQVVMQNRDGDWQTMEELRQAMQARGGGRRGGNGGGNGGGAAGGDNTNANAGGGNNGGGGGGAARGRGGFGGGGGFFGGGGQGNPAQELATLLPKAKDPKADGDALVATLSAEDVTPMLTFGGGRGGRGGGGQTPPAPKNASGSIKFWVKDGALTKFEVHVHGTITGRNGENEFDRTTTTELKNVGTTKVDVPDAAKKKLGA